MQSAFYWKIFIKLQQIRIPNFTSAFACASCFFLNLAIFSAFLASLFIFFSALTSEEEDVEEDGGPLSGSDEFLVGWSGDVDSAITVDTWKQLLIEEWNKRGWLTLSLMMKDDLDKNNLVLLRFLTKYPNVITFKPETVLRHVHTTC